jgi:hypothetical protein
MGMGMKKNKLFDKDDLLVFLVVTGILLIKFLVVIFSAPRFIAPD